MKNNTDTESSTAIAIATLGAWAFALAVIIAHLIYEGWVISKLWSWFVQPYFVPVVMTIPLAIGISALVNTLKPSPVIEYPDDTPKKAFLRAIKAAFLFPTITLLGGYVATFFL
jgi:hypothetical protein